jgi:hypothetical protein
MDDISFEETKHILDNISDLFKSYFIKYNLCNVHIDEYNRLSCNCMNRDNDYWKTKIDHLCCSTKCIHRTEKGCNIKSLKCSMFNCGKKTNIEYEKLKKFIIDLFNYYKIYLEYYEDNTNTTLDIINKNLNIKNVILDEIELLSEEDLNLEIFKKLFEIINN